MKHDEINNPAHYQLFPDTEAIDVIRAALTPEEFIGYLKGSALKYRLRAGDKGPAEKCIGKAHWYQNRLYNLMDEAKDGRGIVGQHSQSTPFRIMARNFIPHPTVKESLPVEWPADDCRIDAIGQNGPTGEHYLADDGA